jgi:hypothetical protein
MDTIDPAEDLGGKLKEAMVNNLIRGDVLLNGIDSIICNHFHEVKKWDAKIQRGSILIHVELGYDNPLKLLALMAETWAFEIIG